MSNTQSSNDLEQGLKPRHVTMLSIAGVIGAGLFVGSGHAIAAGGPRRAAGLCRSRYAGGAGDAHAGRDGRCLARHRFVLHLRRPCHRPLGRFTIGWLYWWFWVLVIPLEANAAATILHAWFPDVAIWVFTLVITLLLTATNLFSVKNYGEFEFWFALVKVLAIIGFVILGVLAIFGLLPGSQVSGVSHLFDTRLFAQRHGRGTGGHADHHVLVHGH
jgi:GABA permease